MCGRAACGLDPETICNACGYKSKDGKWTAPEWKKSSNGKEFQSSYNICPGAYVPVLLSKEHFPDLYSVREPAVDKELASQTIQCYWVVQPMQWGLVPSWHTGDPKSVMYNMINARSDGLLTKRTFKTPLEKGRRCVILLEGFYEWQTSKDGKKQPYFIYFPAALSSTVEKVNKMSDEQMDTDVPEGEWTGKRLLTLAGLFDVYHSKEDTEGPLYSCSVITVDAHTEFNWLHDRMPAVLNGEEEVKEWLDFSNLPLNKAFDKLIRPVEGLQWHPVSTAVNNNKNKSDECVQPIDLEKIRQKEQASSNLMKSWLTGTKRKHTEDVKPTIEDVKMEKGDVKPDIKPDMRELKPKIEVKVEPGVTGDDVNRNEDGALQSKLIKLEPKTE